jgi:proline racemase
MFEPRGHSAMSGAILQPPARQDADWGVLFIEVSGCLPMCGHGAIGVATALVETGMVQVTEPTTIVRLDTPAGLVLAEVQVHDGHAESVTIENVPSFLLDPDLSLDLPGIGQVQYDMAFGGNFYAILPAQSVGRELEIANVPRLIATGLQILQVINSTARPIHPLNRQIDVCHHVLFTAPGQDGSSGRNTVVVNPGWIDRSPCGTGTSARMAQLYSRGELRLHQPYIHDSVLGSRFVGELVGTVDIGGREAVIPRITGRAWIHGLTTHLLDPTDPFPKGFLIPS